MHVTFSCFSRLLLKTLVENEAISLNEQFLLFYPTHNKQFLISNVFLYFFTSIITSFTCQFILRVYE